MSIYVQSKIDLKKDKLWILTFSSRKSMMISKVDLTTRHAPKNSCWFVWLNNPCGAKVFLMACYHFLMLYLGMFWVWKKFHLLHLSSWWDFSSHSKLPPKVESIWNRENNHQLSIRREFCINKSPSVQYKLLRGGAFQPMSYIPSSHPRSKINRGPRQKHREWA